LTFDYLFYLVCGNLQGLYYLIASSFLAGSLQPLAGHFVAEHYFFSRVNYGTESLAALKGKPDVSPLPPSLTPPETYSYYGPGNIFVYNVGLHNEHHDFPAIPWTRLHKLHEIAKEFYEPLPCHRSWVWVIITFIRDPNVGMWCRVKRAQGGRLVGGGKGVSTPGKRIDDSGWTENELEVSGQ
ncbi:hypothetical protein KEM55_006856, partial [Ascosphaera atra]